MTLLSNFGVNRHAIWSLNYVIDELASKCVDIKNETRGFAYGLVSLIKLASLNQR